MYLEYTLFMVDDENRLKGRLSLERLYDFYKTQIADIYIKKVTFVNVDAEDVEVAYHAEIRSRSYSCSGCHGTASR
jgi:Mg/Co/Ni transporter MgtE